MKTNRRFLLAAIFGLAITFTLSCSGGDDGGGNDPNGGTSSPSSSPSGGGGSSPSGGGGSCDMSGYQKQKMPDGKTWMTENLNCIVAGSECYEKKESYCNTYGRLYTWEAAKKACSGGWHLPSNDEWEALVTAVGGASTAGKHLKAKKGWYSCGPTGSGKDYLCEDTYGFSALPGGFGGSDGSFRNADGAGVWWSASEYLSDIAYGRGMLTNLDLVLHGGYNKDNLYSVRCVQDSP